MTFTEIVHLDIQRISINVIEIKRVEFELNLAFFEFSLILLTRKTFQY